MFKKFIIIFNITFFMFSFYNISFADDITEDDSEIFELDDIIETSTEAADEIKINSRIAVAYDRSSGKVIWGKDENKRSAMASTTKIMTAIVVVENSNLDDIVTISAKAAGTGGSRLGLKKDDKISVKDLLYGLMLRSGNDAAVALAEHVGGNVTEFANLMNNKASELNLKDTHFVTPHGLDDPEHYTTAFELAKITDYALNNETISKIVGSKYYTISINGYPKNLINTNELLGNINGAYGVKTGFTNNAGRCLVTSVKRADLDIITVVLQADTKKDRGKDSAQIIEYVYKNYTKFNVKELVDKEFESWCNINKGRLNINKAKNMNFNLKKDELQDEFIVVKNSNINNINVNISAIFEFEAPVERNTTIGKLKVTVGNEIVDIVDIYIDTFVEKKNVWDYFFDCIKAYTTISGY